MKITCKELRERIAGLNEIKRLNLMLVIVGSLVDASTERSLKKDLDYLQHLLNGYSAHCMKLFLKKSDKGSARAKR